MRIFSKIRAEDLQSTAKNFPMPKSLEYIKILGSEGIAWQGLHVTDAFSLVCSIRIDAAKKYLHMKGQERLKKAGVNSFTSATQEDFDSL